MGGSQTGISFYDDGIGTFISRKWWYWMCKNIHILGDDSVGSTFGGI